MTNAPKCISYRASSAGFGAITKQRSRASERSWSALEAYAEVAYSPTTVAEQAKAALAWLGVERATEYQSPLKRLYANGVVDRFDNPDDVLTDLERIGRPEWTRE